MNTLVDQMKTLHETVDCVGYWNTLTIKHLEREY